MNKKYVLFGAAAALAIAGVVYVGTGSNLQASVGSITEKTSRPKVVTPVYSGGTNPGKDTNRVAISVTTYPGLEKEAQAYLDNVAAINKKLQTLIPSSSGDKVRHLVPVTIGVCALTGVGGRFIRYVEC